MSDLLTIVRFSTSLTLSHRICIIGPSDLHRYYRVRILHQHFLNLSNFQHENYCRVLELSKSVSNKRVQQLYSQDQSQEMIDQAVRQATSARWTLENIQRVDEAGLSRNSPKYPRTPRVTKRHKYARDDTPVMYIWGIAWANNPTGTSNCTWYQKVLITRSRNCFGISNRGSWLPWSDNAHGMQHTRRELGRQPRWFSHHMDKTEYKSPWRIFREFRSQSVWDVCCRNTVMAKITWPLRC